MVGTIAVVLSVEETQVANRRRSREVFAWRNEHGQAMAAKVVVDRDDSEYKEGGEGLHRAAIGRFAEVQWIWKESMAFTHGHAIGQLK